MSASRPRELVGGRGEVWKREDGESNSSRASDTKIENGVSHENPPYGESVFLQLVIYYFLSTSCCLSVSHACAVICNGIALMRNNNNERGVNSMRSSLAEDSQFLLQSFCSFIFSLSCAQIWTHSLACREKEKNRFDRLGWMTSYLISSCSWLREEE